MRPTPPERAGIVVGRTDFGETDRILRLLTPDAGRLSVLARGARTGKRFSADVAARVRFGARDSRGGLAPLVMLEVEDGRARLRNSFARLTLAAYFCEVAGSLAREDHAEPRLYGLLETALLVLDAVDTDPASALRAGFEAKALTFAGIAPVLDRCVACSRAPDADLWFSPAGGGVFHVGCLPAGDASAVAVSPAFAQALEAARRAPLASLVDTALPPGPIDALSDCVAVHLGRPLQSRALLDALG